MKKFEIPVLLDFRAIRIYLFYLYGGAVFVTVRVDKNLQLYNGNIKYLL